MKFLNVEIFIDVMEHKREYRRQNEIVCEEMEFVPSVTRSLNVEIIGYTSKQNQGLQTAQESVLLQINGKVSLWKTIEKIT